MGQVDRAVGWGRLLRHATALSEGIGLQIGGRTTDLPYHAAAASFRRVGLAPALLPDATAASLRCHLLPHPRPQCKPETCMQRRCNATAPRCVRWLLLLRRLVKAWWEC